MACIAMMSVMTDRIDVTLNVDGTVSSMSAIATLKKGAECPTAQLKQMGIKVRFVLGDMVALNVPADKLLQLEQVEAFSYVAADEILYPMNDKSREASNVDLAADEPLSIEAGQPQAYTGQGVVLGIIDQGIDFNHAAFRKDDGSTRIVKVIEHPIREKEEYTSDEEIKALTTDYESSSHGTHVSSAAGGSDLGNGLQGMAPEGDLYTNGDGTIAFNTSVCDESVISVGAYVTRSEWTNYLGEVMHNPTSALTLKPPMGTARLHPPQCTLWMLPSIT